ncbi:hypothetical protein R6Q59_026450 [Mikania micrantha]
MFLVHEERLVRRQGTICYLYPSSQFLRQDQHEPPPTAATVSFELFPVKQNGGDGRPDGAYSASPYAPVSQLENLKILQGTHRKPSLPLRSPITLRPRRPVQSSLDNIQTPSDLKILRGTDRKPSLPLRSPIMLHSRRPFQSTLDNIQTPSGTLTKPPLPRQSWVTEKHEICPKYHAMSCELPALTKMVQDTLRASATTNRSANEGPLFQRVKIFEEYAARRNEILKRKRGESSSAEKKTPCIQYLGVRVESQREQLVKSRSSSARGR